MATQQGTKNVPRQPQGTEQASMTLTSKPEFILLQQQNSFTLYCSFALLVVFDLISAWQFRFQSLN